MTPREALEFIKGDEYGDNTLWRDPTGKHYLLSRSGAERRFSQEGFIRVETVRVMRQMFGEIPSEGVVPGSPLWQLLEDMKWQEG